MGAKYEISYWDYTKREEVVAEHTNSLLRTMWLVHYLEKRWFCVTVKLRRDKVRI